MILFQADAEIEREVSLIQQIASGVVIAVIMFAFLLLVAAGIVIHNWHDTTETDENAAGRHPGRTGTDESEPDLPASAVTRARQDTE